MNRPTLYILLMMCIAVGIAVGVIVYAEEYFPEIGVEEPVEPHGRVIGPVQVALDDPGEYEVLLQSEPLVVLDAYNRPKSVQVRMMTPGLNVAHAICYTHPRLSDEVQLYFQEHQTRFADTQNKEEMNTVLAEALGRRLDSRAVTWAILVDSQETATEQSENDIYECRDRVARRVIRRIYQ